MIRGDALALNEYLTKEGHIDKVYDALQHDDPAEVVLTIMDILPKTEIITNFPKKVKSESTSATFRESGNYAYTSRDFKQAFKFYNQAIMYAPENSPAMMTAFSNRSALLFTVQAFSACLEDIETAFSMGCVDHKLAQRLRDRKKECLRNAWKEKNIAAGEFAINYFQFNVKRHPEIPCASSDIKIVTDSELPKVIASKDISVGALVALETPFIAELQTENYYISCYYCHKAHLNLIPCRGCCFVLFCDETCMSKCNEEFHDVECAIRTCIELIATGESFKMKIKAAIKMRRMCKSWKELISESYNSGIDRMKNSSVSDVYDQRSKFSLLNYNRDKHFIYGEMYNDAFNFAILLHNLKNLSSFFPKDKDESIAAIRAIARIMMNLSSERKIQIINGANDVCKNLLTSDINPNYGWFSFAGKLKHCCEANLLAVGVTNKLALIAVKPIIKGAELTISYLGNYYENLHAKRQYRLFCICEQICSCDVCTQDWGSFYRRKHFTDQETTALRNWVSYSRSAVIGRDKALFKATCETLSALDNAQNTSEHHEIYRAFRSFLVLCQCWASKNKII